MKKLYNRIRVLLSPLIEKIRLVITSFSKKEKVVFLVFVIVLFIGTFGLLIKINNSFMVQVPRHGGSISEGIIGSPRFINPVLSYSSADNDLVALVYSGLMRKDNNDNLIPDLAESYEISKDGLNYTFVLKDKIFFHDGEPITADDIIFTIDKVKDPIIKSPQKINWEGISVSKIDDKTIMFSLKRPYSSFLENTTLGILPAHLWENSPTEINDYNINPIGSGPFKIEKVDKQSNGIINSLELKSFKRFALGKPYIDGITFKFYANESELISALLGGEVEQISSITPKNASILKDKKYTIKSFVLPRIFGLFFNQNKNQIFTNKSVVKAIDLAIDKNRIIQEVLSNYGEKIDGPIPPSMIAYQKIDSGGEISWEENLKKAEEILSKDGWTKGEDGSLVKTKTVKKKKFTESIEFSISTSNTPELAQVAEIIKENLASLGMRVEIKTFEAGNLSQLVIRPREYEALLFGQIVSNESDLSAFWHSSQRKDPGQNIALYTSAKADKILEEAPSIVDENARIKKYIQFEDEIRKDLPAIFIYSPNFIYVVSKNLKGISFEHLAFPADRFSNSYLWYLKTDHVWKVFAK